jgi:hypothetical protein
MITNSAQYAAKLLSHASLPFRSPGMGLEGISTRTPNLFHLDFPGQQAARKKVKARSGRYVFRFNAGKGAFMFRRT